MQFVSFVLPISFPLLGAFGSCYSRDAAPWLPCRMLNWIFCTDYCLCECVQNWCSMYSSADCTAVTPVLASLQYGQPNEKFLVGLFFSPEVFYLLLVMFKWCHAKFSCLFFLKVTYWEKNSPTSSLYPPPPPPPYFLLLVYLSRHINLKGPHGVFIIGERVRAIH